MNCISRNLIVAGAFAASFLLLAQPAEAKKLYKWVDKNGKISYQDKPPPTNAKILEESELKASPAPSSNQDNQEPIIVYVSAGCDPCDEVVRYLNQLKVPHIERALQDDREAQQRLLDEYESLSVPTLFIGDSIMPSPSTDKIKTALRSAGYTFEESTPKAETEQDTEEDAGEEPS